MSNQLGSYLAVIKVVGIGGGGTNAVTRMVEAGLSGVEFVAVNTDAQALLMTEADEKIHIGSRPRGVSAPAPTRASARPLRRRAGTSSRRRSRARTWCSSPPARVAGRARAERRSSPRSDARSARSPSASSRGRSRFEGKLRSDQAEQGIQALRDSVDALIVIENDRLLQVVERSTPVTEAFGMADDILRQGVQGITDLITVPGLINLDFADVRTIMKDAGSALMGIGSARGENRAVEAARAAISSPLLEQSLDGATGILLNITGGPELGLAEVDEAAEVVRARRRLERERHLRRGDQRRHGRRGSGHRHRDRLRNPSDARRRVETPVGVAVSSERERPPFNAPSVRDVEIDIPSFLKED